MIRPVFPVLDYMVNLKEYKEYCVNKELVALQCNGKCHLAKKIEELKKAPLQEKKVPELGEIEFEKYPVTYFSSAFIQVTYTLIDRITSPDYYNTSHEDYLGEIFIPPPQV